MKRKFSDGKFVSKDVLAVRAIHFSTFICLAVFVAAIPLPRVDGMLAGSDGLRYYSILRSIFFDFDFDFANDYKLMGVDHGPLTVTGLQPCNFAIGTSLLWLPFFALAHLIALSANWLGASVSLDGTGYLHQAFVCCGSVIYAGAGFALVFKVSRKLFSVRSSLAGVMVAWWASQAVYYIIAEPSMSHAASIFTGAVFLHTWRSPSLERGPADWFKIGLAVGLAALVRWQDGVLVILPMAELARGLLQRRLPAREALTSGLLIVLAASIVFSPQFLMWETLYGFSVVIPQTVMPREDGDFFQWASPSPLLALFSTRHGLISWHPVFLFALAGLASLWKRDRGLTLAIIFMLLAQLYINSSATVWWGHDSFGGRRFTSLVPLLTRRHRLVEKFLCDTLGISWHEVHKHACELEHGLTPLVEEKLASFLNFPEFCPHGTPMPGADDKLPEDMISMDKSETGDIIEIIIINESMENSLELMKFLQERNIVPGKRHRIEERLEVIQSVALKSGEETFNIPFDIAAKIGVLKVG